MSNEYLPPIGTRLPFNFSKSGYSSPSSTSTHFNFTPQGNFGVLKAAVNVLQPYWYETYTYSKECPKYVIGYGPGGIQIIKGRCIFGGIRDLQGIIIGQPKGYTEGSLPAYINSVIASGVGNLSSRCLAVKPQDLTAYIDKHGPEDLGGEIIPEKWKDTGSLPVFVGAHAPRDIAAWIDVHCPGDLGGVLEGIKRKSSGNLGMTLGGTHTPVSLRMTLEDTHFPENVRASIKAWQKDFVTLSAFLDGFKNRSSQLFPAMVGIHDPINLSSSIRMWGGGSTDLLGSLKSWVSSDLGAQIDEHQWVGLKAKIGGSGKGREDFPAILIVDKYKGFKVLSGYIDTHCPTDLSLSITGVKSSSKDLGGLMHSWHERCFGGLIDTHGPRNLGSVIRGWFSDVNNLGAAIKVWRSGTKDLGSYIDMHLPVDLGSDVGMHAPSNLFASADSHKYEELWIILRTWHRGIQVDLHSYIRGWQDGNISATLGAHNPRDLRVYMRAWQREVFLDFPANIYGWQQGQDIRAEIDAHSPRDIKFIIRGWKREAQKDLSAAFWGWEQRGLSAYLFPHPYHDLLAVIRPWYRGLSGALAAQLRVWQDGNLSAISAGHVWGVLTAKVLPHPPPPLPATIRGWQRDLQQNLLANTYGWGKGDISGTVGAHQWNMLTVIMKGVFLGAERDITGSMYGWDRGNLGVIIDKHSPRDLGILLKGVVLGVTTDLSANFWGWEERCLGVTTKGGHLPRNLIAHVRICQRDYLDLSSNMHGWAEIDLGAIASGHLPGEIPATIRSWYRGNTKDLVGLIYGWQDGDLGGIIGGHSPENLRGIIKVSERTFRLFPASIWGWKTKDLSMTLGGTHAPVDLQAYVDVAQRKTRLLNALIRGWQRLDLSAFINVVHLYDLSAVLQSIPPKNLPAYLKVRPQSTLSANTYGWGMLNLGAVIIRIYDVALPAKIHGRDDMFSNLQAKLRGVGTSVVRNLTSFVRNMHYRTLSACLRATYLASIQAYLRAIQPRDLNAKIHAWHTRDLQGILNGCDYPWNLTAAICPTGGWDLLTANIFPKTAIAIYTNLKASVHPWEIRHLMSSITGANAPFLRAIITPLGYSSALHASIRPKMIRLTTVIDIPTMNHKDLSAIINYPCFKTGWSDLGTYICPIFKSDLYAYIKAIRYNYKPALLGAKTGYTDSISEVDKLKLCITIYPNEVISEDKLKVYFTIFSAGNLLSAYIKSIMMHKQLTATIVAEGIDHFVYPTLVKNREVVIHKTYEGVFKQFEYVEFAFKSIVEDYYYSSDGNYVWKKDRVDRWVLDVKSYLPTDTSLRLKRRLHKATTLYDFRKFPSVDAAMKYAIAYVTEHPYGNLGATIYNKSRYEGLTSTINPKYVHSTLTGLGANIIPEDFTIILSAGDGILKI